MKKQFFLLALTISAVLFIAKNNINKNENLSDFSKANAQDRQKDSVSGVILAPLSFSASNGEDEKIQNSCAVSINAKAALAKYLDQSHNTFVLNPRNFLPIASISKLMTALVAADNIPQNKEIRFSENAINTEGIAGEFRSGELFRAKDLTKAMLIVSSNDAAVALAEFLGEKKFVDLINKKTQAINMFDTHFAEPTGLSALNQSTAIDLSKLVSYIYYNYPDILEITTQKERKIFDLEKGNFKKLININMFAGEPDFIGGKTGHLDDDNGRNLAALFKRNGRIVLTIVISAENAFEETKKLLTCF
ncbi:D-alanyl-D-alanine carboxypeptidase [Candidatus Wolfebacteria bacterium]|nr:D-alanyl-D-alanine carboxypeptidase [Candidatus Wolfebacteria bacterium]